MKDIIAKVDRELVLSELNAERFVRDTNKGGNKIFIVNAHNSPNTMREIGRLREISFREAGGGTGKEIDIDKYDTQECPYEQLIVWDPDANEILGGYRFQMGWNIKKDENGDLTIATSRLFTFTDLFTEYYLPHTIELGRSFVQPEYQSSKAGAKALFALDNLWDGLGALAAENDGIKYFIGKVTMYADFNQKARDLILGFMNKYFPDPEHLLHPRKQIRLGTPWEEIVSTFSSGHYNKDYKVLNKMVRDLGVNIPPLVNAYMNLSPTMRTFGTAVNDVFGNVEETGIMITIADIFDKKKERYIKSYIKNHPEQGRVELK